MSLNPHDEFMRLAALDITGELSPDERALLEEHLSRCEDCRHAMLDFHKVAMNILPALAAEAASAPGSADESEPWSHEKAEKRLMETLDKEPPPSKHGLIRRLTPAQRKIWSIVGISIASGVIGYGGLRGHYPLPDVAPKNTVRLHCPDDTRTPVAASSNPPQSNAVHESPDEALLVAALRKELQAARVRDGELESQLALDNLQLGRRDQELTMGATERDRLAQQLAGDQVAMQTLQDRLAVVQQETARGAARLVALQTEMASVNTVVESKDRTIAEDQELLQHDRDIRNLMGAPDLYIADIKDVAEDGKARKPFGRVFYTRDKSLIFYGFDLDRQPGLKESAVFQAWGRRDAEKEVSLGVFYRDETNQRRWILKFNDADTLARLDSVFVTAEPHGGSIKPTGKPLLSTYLRLPANHP